MRRRRGSRNGQRGFTLIEVLVALVLAAIAMIGVIALYRAQTNVGSFSRRSVEATALAEDHLEKLRTVAGGAAVGTTTVTGLDETGKTGGIYSRSHEITTTANYDEIKVVVSWQEEGRTKSVTVVGRRNL